MSVPRFAEVFQFEMVWTISAQPADWPQPLIAHKSRIELSDELKENRKFVADAINSARVIIRRAP